MNDEDRSSHQPARVLFDVLGIAYEKAFAGSEAHQASLRWLLGELAPRSRVLDVGSGTGRPTAAVLAAAGHEVLGEQALMFTPSRPGAEPEPHLFVHCQRARVPSTSADT